MNFKLFCAMMVFGPNSTTVVNFNCFCSTNQRTTKYRQPLLTIYHMTVHKRRQRITKILVLSFDSQATTRYSPQTNQLQNGIPFPRSNNREGFSAYQIQLCITKIYVQLSWFLVILWLNLKPYGHTEFFGYYTPGNYQTYRFAVHSVQKLMLTNTFDTVPLPIQQYFLISCFPYFTRW